MASKPPDAWRDDLAAAVPWIDADRAVWRGNMNEASPWRVVVGDIELHDGRRVVLKYHDDDAELMREWAALQLLAEPGAPSCAPRCLGLDATRKTLASEWLGGSPLSIVLNQPQARDALLESARVVAALHAWSAEKTSRWLELWPDDQSPSMFPVYDLSDAELMEPFLSVGGEEEGLAAAIRAVREALIHPGPLLGFTHGDLQTRHFLCEGNRVRLVDWEQAGLRHQLYDVACILDKTRLEGRRLPDWAVDAVIAEYARARRVDEAEVRAALMPVLAYEWLVGIAEDWKSEPRLARMWLRDLIEFAREDRALAAFVDAGQALYATLEGEDLPIFPGLAETGDPRRG